MSDDILIKRIQTSFSMYGLTITKNLSNYVAVQLRSQPAEERETWLTRIIEELLNQNLESPNIQKEDIKRALIECARPEESLQDTETIISVINAYDIPKIVYDIGKKRFILQKVIKDLYPDAKFKMDIFKDRLSLLYHRTLRHDKFLPPKFGEKTEKLELIPIENLLNESKTEYVYVIGLLSQITEGQFYLEDSSEVVKLDLRKTNFQSSLIMEGSTVIAYGKYTDNVFVVKDIGFPPPEPSSNTRAAFADLNTFGGAHPTSLKKSEKLKIHEQTYLNETIIFISEFWLDDIKVLEKFQTILNGFSDDPPIAFVLCGNFLHSPLDATSAQKLQDGFKSLTDIILQYSEILRNTKFIIVPGPQDLGAPKILPRATLPKSQLEDFIKQVPGAILTTNPCRIQYCTKEIVVFREDVLTKLCRNTLKFLNTENVYEDYAKSIICQSHLIPLTLQAMPVYWKYDHTLQVFPTPDVIVVADSYATYKTNFSDCHVTNPGSFARGGFTFKMYVPSENIIEDCEIND